MNHYIFNLFLVLIWIVILPGCMTRLKPLKIGPFYTTSYSGNVKENIDREEKLRRKQGYPIDRGVGVTIFKAPPRVSKFKKGERICIATYASKAESSRSNYTYVEPDYYGTGWRKSYTSKRTIRNTATGTGSIPFTRIIFAGIILGDYYGGWVATCTTQEKVDKLKPGTYRAELRTVEHYTKRKRKFETTFTVE